MSVCMCLDHTHDKFQMVWWCVSASLYCRGFFSTRTHTHIHIDGGTKCASVCFLLPLFAIHSYGSAQFSCAIDTYTKWNAPATNDSKMAAFTHQSSRATAAAAQRSILASDTAKCREKENIPLFIPHDITTLLRVFIHPLGKLYFFESFFFGFLLPFIFSCTYVEHFALSFSIPFGRVAMLLLLQPSSGSFRTAKRSTCEMSFRDIPSQ